MPRPIFRDSSGVHGRILRQLFRYTTLVGDGQLNIDEDGTRNPPDQIEIVYLDANDLTKGRKFNDATLPIPLVVYDDSPRLPSTLPFQAPYKAALPVFPKSSHSPIVGAPSLEEQLRAASASPSVATQTLPFVDLAPQSDTINVTRPLPFSQGVLPSSRAAPSTLEEGGVAKAANNAQGPPGSNRTDILAVQDERVKDVVATETPAVDPKAIEPPLEEPQSAAASPSSATTSRPRAPQVVHLPPKDTQEARLLGTEQKLDKAVDKQRKEEERLAIPPSNGATDLVSSPSSTVGAYSQATPHAPHHSPDTSPETDPYHERTQAHESVDNGVDSAAQQIEEDHERSLRAQMKEAKEMARVMSSPTPEIERQIEDEQAIRLARDGKPDLGSSRHGLLQQAGQVASEITLKNQLNVEAIIATADDPAADSLPTPTTTAPEPSTLDLQTIEEPTRTTEEAQTHPTPPADTDADMNEAPGLLEQQGPQRSSPRTERMATQVSSSAMRAKPVAEIIEGKLTPKSVISPRSSNISASISPPRPKTRRLKPDEVATVIFAKKSPSRSSKTLQAYNEDYASLQGASEDSSRDYLEGLFKFQSHHPPRSIPLQELVASAQKTLSTAGSLAMIREHQDYKILKRVYQLQNANRWSLRQIHKAVEPERQFTHHDQLLLDMKWMQTDFREERKWKKSLAATFAEWCAEYVNSNPEDQVVLRVNACVPQVAKARNDNDEDMHDAPTPELLYSHAHETESDSYADEDELRTPLNATPPAGIFSLGFDDVVLKIDRTSASDTLFRELPFYEPMLEGSSDGNPFSLAQPPILPVSKYVTGKLVSQIRGPPRKRSRYDYDSEDEPSTPPSRSGTSAEHSMPSTPGRRLFCRNDLPPEMNDVALFNTDNKHVRDRLQAAHSFRPPTEFNMPTVAFFENRIPSQWLWEEDQKLRALVKEFTFNWSLVSQQLALPSMFVSGSGRRTPWECFERWVSLEGLPAEMSKTQYFRTYQGRLESANKTVFAQYQAQQQQQQGQQGTTGQPRRRPTTVPIRVERRRENRHLAIIDGMRKLARKRESAAHKQAESQKAAALRKAHEPATPKANVHTPQEFSRLKWEREEKLKMKLQQQQQEMAARNHMAQRQAQMQAQAGMSNGVNQMQRNGTSAGNVGFPIQISTSQQGQNLAAMAARAHPSQQGSQTNFANGSMPIATPGVPQAQMQGNLQNAQRMGPPDQMRMAMQRDQFANLTPQQQAYLRQQQMGMTNNLGQGVGMNSVPNANMIASSSNQNVNHVAMNGMPNSAGSPRMSQPNGTVQTPSRPLSSGHLPSLGQISNNIKAQYPEWAPDRIQKAAADHHAKMVNKQRQQAMSAAAGASGSSAMSPSSQLGNNHYNSQNGAMANHSPSGNAVQNYQQQLVQQQRMMSMNNQARPQVGSPGMSARPPSRSATPQNPQMQPSPVMQQPQLNRS